MEENGKWFRPFLPDLTQSRFVTLQKQDAHEYASIFKGSAQPPWLHALWQHWRQLSEEPFRGITNDGVVRSGFFPLQDEGVAVPEIAVVAQELLPLLDESWSNPEFLLSDKGMRLDEVALAIRTASLKLLEHTLSPEGYQKALGAMRINGFLGRLVNAPRICNDLSYNLALLGTPSLTSPWGFSFYGHYLCLNILLYRNQIVVSPCFTGERLGLQLTQSLPLQLRANAQIYKLLHDPSMSHGRWNHDDQQHLCGAYRENRVVPYEGVRVSDMSSSGPWLVTAIISQFIQYLPTGARTSRLEQAESWYHETPVISIEFDHHSRVFLNNDTPAKFHIHTVLRTPNGGDYGMAIRPLMETISQEFVWGGGGDD
ncbi:hypothetical protein COCMIDRAFT_41388 [Bipolaris oryzae ATCC 44560]|uniref:Uncharacterized protein n=1 Tax=Bipolaris oryzae ATCC 44560 TaxID=930090 RepID=W6YM15_COCMI|nr:uncharacterized protein COCMIDRAFT_41388 [Bipolaris oryzae ATCC 44560]EUC40257.1 hypothetical protein COCMIDRAFT_41388 [Bipolaris oryzae ATCC 44560]